MPPRFNQRFYYTPVKLVFVAALTAMGLVMIVLWGKTWVEEAALNLAGLVAPVVAFVPTPNLPNNCGLDIATTNQNAATAQRARVVAASKDDIYNNMTAYFTVVLLVLFVLLVAGILAIAQDKSKLPAPLARFLRLEHGWPLVTEHPRGYWVPWGVATALAVFAAIKLWFDSEWFYDNAHATAAITLFFFIIIGVVDIGFQKWNPRRRAELEPWDEEKRGLAKTYWTLAAAMALGTLLIQLGADYISDDFAQHKTFFIEAWLILLLAAFWMIQTIDRANEGAPHGPGERQAQGPSEGPPVATDDVPNPTANVEHAAR